MTSLKAMVDQVAVEYKVSLSILIDFILLTFLLSSISQPIFSKAVH